MRIYMAWTIRLILIVNDIHYVYNLYTLVHWYEDYVTDRVFRLHQTQVRHKSSACPVQVVISVSISYDDNNDISMVSKTSKTSDVSHD